MPFIAPIIATAIGAGIIGEIAIGVGLSLAMGAAARALAPKPRDYSSAATTGMRLSARYDANAAREIPFGRVATAGTIVYQHTWGPNRNEYLDMLFALGDCPCDALETVYVNGVAVTVNGDYTVSEYAGMSVIFRSGAADQVVFDELVARSNGRYTSADRGAGVCYVWVRMLYDPNLYSSIPKFLFVMRGAKLYDWRQDSTAGGSGAQRWGQPATYAWSDNPVVCLYNYRRGIWLGSQRLAGMNTPAAALPVSIWTAAANACDEAVTLKAGGTEKRYRLNGIVSTNSVHRAVVEDILSAMAGQEIDSGGTIKVFAGVAQTAVMSLTDADIIVDSDVDLAAKRPRSELVNAVFGTFSDPASLYERVALPPRISPSDEAADGGVRLEESYALEMVTSQTQGQRILEIIRRRHRNQIRVKLKVRAKFCVLEAGDWITWTSARYGYSAATFEVSSATYGLDQCVTLSLRDTSASVYAWSAGSDELDRTAPGTVPAGGSTYITVAGLTVTNIVISSAGTTSRPGLAIAWTAPTDRSVVALRVQYRRLGDTVALERRVLDPLAGASTWIDGVQGNTIYQVRVLPETLPERACTWTSWVQPASGTAPVSVDVAASATSVPAGTITKAMLDAQSAFELSLSTAQSTLFDSVEARFDDIWEACQNASEAAIQSLVRVSQEYNDRKAAVVSEALARATADELLARQIVSVRTTAGTTYVQVTQIQSSVDGIRGMWGIQIDVNGNVVGAIKLDGTAAGSTLNFLANKVTFYDPTADAGAAKALLTLQTISGATKLALNGELIVNAINAGTVTVGSLSALSANCGTITAGVLRSSDNKFVIDLTGKSFQILV